MFYLKMICIFNLVLKLTYYIRDSGFCLAVFKIKFLVSFWCSLDMAFRRNVVFYLVAS